MEKLLEFYLDIGIKTCVNLAMSPLLLSFLIGKR
jgi:hypothetical protein